MSWLANWSKRVKLSIDNTKVDGVLTNFPTLIHLSTSSGQGSTDVSAIFDELGADANRKKIAVTEDDGTTQCYVEIERWDDANEVAWLWVKVPSVASGADTELYIYYDSSQADNTTYVGDTTDVPAQNVWDSNFKGVWHMAQDPNGDPANGIKDSTSNANHGTPAGSMTSADLVNGKIGKALDFDGGNDFIDFDGWFSLNDYSHGTFEATFKLNAVDGIRHIISARDGASVTRLYLTSNSGIFEVFVGDTGSGIGTINIGTWYCGTIIWNASDFSTYLNSVLKTDAVAYSSEAGTGDKWLAVASYCEALSQPVNGIIDEVRISNIARSVEWVKATYYSNWDDFVNFGSEEIYLEVEITEDAGIDDTFTRFIEGERTLQNDAGLGDQFDAINLSDIITNNVGLSDQFDAFNLSDIINNATGLDDQFEAVVLAGKITEESGLNDSLIRIVEALRSISDEVGINAQFDVVKILHASIEETCGLTDSLPYGINQLQAKITSSGIQTQHARPCSIPFPIIQSSILQLSAPITTIQAVQQTITEEPIQTIQSILQTIDEKTWVSMNQMLLQSLEDPAVSFHTVDWDLLLDGVSIKGDITELQVTYSENSVHNSISVSSTSEDLFWVSNPYEKTGESRLKLTIGTRTLYFLLENRNGSEEAFSFGGRSLSAREEIQFAKSIEYLLEEPKSAKAVALEILTVSSLSWLCNDWVLPKGFGFEGPPLAGVKKIASVIDAVVRCSDEGTIIVRNRFPVRPVDMPNASVAKSFDRANVIALSYDEKPGKLYNAVEVLGQTFEPFIPDHEIEEDDLKIGKTVHVQIFWGKNKPKVTPETYVTDGTVVHVGSNLTLEVEETRYTFERGKSSVSKPIKNIKQVKWIGDSGGAVSFEENSKILELSEELYRVAKITYTTVYDRYRANNHSVEYLLILLGLTAARDVSVLVYMGEGDSEATSISDSNLTSENIARIRGVAFLDRSRYNFKTLTLQTPYSDVVIDGVLVYLNDARINCLGNFHVQNANIRITGPQVINETGVIQCQIQ